MKSLLNRSVILLLAGYPLLGCDSSFFSSGAEKSGAEKPETADPQALASTASAPDPSQVYITGFTYAGTGCPANSASSNISVDAKAITLAFDQYYAEVGPGAEVGRDRVNCQVSLNIHAPAGYSYTLFTLDVRGFAGLDAGVTGELKSTFYFQGQQLSDEFSYVLHGETNDLYNVRTEANIESDVYSSCVGAPRALNINTEIRLSNGSNPSAIGNMSVDSVDGEFTHQYGLAWQACQPPTPGNQPLAGTHFVAVGPGSGLGAPVNVYDLTQPSSPVATFQPFGPLYASGIRVALADVNGDGSVDLIAGTETDQAPRVVAIDGRDGHTLFDMAPFSGTGGVYVAAGDVDGDGIAEIVAAAGKGVAPEVKIYKVDGTLLRTAMVYEPTFLGGVRVAMGDFNGDHILDIATATPPGGGPRVRLLNGSNLSVLRDDFVYESSFRGGVWIAAGDVNGDGIAEVITGADVGGGPRVRVLRASDYSPITEYFAYDQALRTGVRVSSVDYNGDKKAEVIVAAGVGGGPHIRLLQGATGSDILSFWGGDPASRTGFYVSGAVAPGN